jgi:lysozyme
MKTSQTGINLIKHYEGLSLKKYLCPAGLPTIGYGHKLLPDENWNTVTNQQADDLLAHDLIKVESCINNNVNVPITQPQFDSLASFVFNLGCSNFHASTLLQLINDEQYLLAADEFCKWDHCKGKELEGLLDRREAEKQLFLSGC